MRRAQVSVWAVLTVVAFSAAPASAVWADGAGLRLDGAGVSYVGADLRVLAVDARSDSSGPAEGTVSFVHVAPAGVSRFVGTVTCLSQDDTGQVQFSGQVLEGVTAAGAVLTGKDFFFTLLVGDEPQAFSLPGFADAGARGGCSGGSAQRVPVTYGGYLEGIA